MLSFLQFRKIDFFLLVPAFALSLLSLTTLYYSSNYDLLLKQSIWLSLAVFVYFIFSNIKAQIFKNGRFVFSMFLFVTFLLVAVFLFGETVKGAQSRFYIAGLAIQPVELAKLVLAITLAKYFSKRHVEIAHFKHIFISAVYAGIFAMLTIMQPDLGSAIILLAIWFFIVFSSGISKKHLFLLVTVAIALSAFAWNFALKDYQKDRILNFLNPSADILGSGYNVRQAIIAIGSGGLTGKESKDALQSSLHFLPEYQTDFIFAAYAEIFGFLGVALFFVLFTILFARIALISIKSKDNFAKLFALGAMAFLFSHFIINVGMNLGLLPVTGITLPFVSYGGSHLIVEYMFIGLLTSLQDR